MEQGVLPCLFVRLAEETTMQISVQGNGHTIVFELNDSPAARSLYSQLPMTVRIENYSTNEKIFTRRILWNLAIRH